MECGPFILKGGREEKPFPQALNLEREENPHSDASVWGLLTTERIRTNSCTLPHMEAHGLKDIRNSKVLWWGLWHSAYGEPRHQPLSVPVYR